MYNVVQCSTYIHTILASLTGFWLTVWGFGLKQLHSDVANDKATKLTTKRRVKNHWYKRQTDKLNVEHKHFFCLRAMSLVILLLARLCLPACSEYLHIQCTYVLFFNRHHRTIPRSLLIFLPHFFFLRTSSLPLAPCYREDRSRLGEETWNNWSCPITLEWWLSEQQPSPQQHTDTHTLCQEAAAPAATVHLFRDFSRFFR